MKARFWDPADGKAACHLCPHECRIGEGNAGICGVRKNIGGELIATTYGKVSSLNVDPVEKKPLFHFKPGQEVLSFGSVGCNLRCMHCQNYSISQSKLEEVSVREVIAEEVPELCRKAKCDGVSWTYNEPSMWQEFVYDASTACKAQGLFTTFVTNGYLNPAPLRKLAECIDAMNIDVKGFSEEFYQKVCKARLQPVLDTVELAQDLGIHVEITYLIIPGKNDKSDELRGFCKWIARVNEHIPVHFSQFHPDYLMTDLPKTPIETMDLAKRIATEEGLSFAYLGNVATSTGENTFCPKCGSLAVRRLGYYTKKAALTEDGECAKCGEPLNMVL
jgi:pyruvate formate lyase activating enzyme